MPRTDRTAEVRVLRTVCRNPDYDRRVKYGHEAIEKLEPGTRVIVRRWQEDVLGDGSMIRDCARVELISGDSLARSFSKKAFVNEVIAESDKDEVRSWDEYSQVEDWAGNHINRKVLNKLWANDALRDALKAAYAEASAEGGDD